MTDNEYPKTIEHKKLGLLITLFDFNQKQYEDYHSALFASDAKTVAQKNGVVAACALKAGLISGVDPNTIPTMKPAAVVWLDKIIHAHVLAITMIPPDDDPN